MDGMMAGKMRYDLVSSASKLMSDYFNYTLPGIQTLSLHGCALRDADLKPIFDALDRNKNCESWYFGVYYIS